MSELGGERKDTIQVVRSVAELKAGYHMKGVGHTKVDRERMETLWFHFVLDYLVVESGCAVQHVRFVMEYQ